MVQAIDLRRSTQWAIASLQSAGFGVGFALDRTLFDLVNLHTGRAHQLSLPNAGVGIGLPAPPISGSFSASDYTYFVAPRPVNFEDFDGKGARLTPVSLAIYSYSWLTVWDGPAYFAAVLAKVSITGWGPSIPGAAVGHGVTEVIYGAGTPTGVVTLIPSEPDIPSKEPLEMHVTYVAHEKVEFELAGDALFDFDKADIKKGAATLLEYAGKVVRSKPGRVRIIGYTDSKGTDAYNQGLSERRAAAVRTWLVEHKYANAANVEAQGNGSQYPVAPNTTPTGADDPVGRAKNRRVEIVIDKR